MVGEESVETTEATMGGDAKSADKPKASKETNLFDVTLPSVGSERYGDRVQGLKECSHRPAVRRQPTETYHETGQRLGIRTHEAPPQGTTNGELTCILQQVAVGDNNDREIKRERLGEQE